MEGICCDGRQEVVPELETLHLDNSLTLKSNTDNESMSIESLSLSTDNSSKTTVKSLNENKTNDIIGNKVTSMKSCAVRPNSLQTRDPKPTLVSEKVQRAASPSAKAPVRKKFKTPGRWDAVMTKIEKSKTSNANNNNNNSVIKGKINSNINRNAVTNGSLPKISPSDELSIADDNNSSHLSPSSASVKLSLTSSTAKKTVVNPNASKVNIPKSKTFVRDSSDSNGNHSTGSKSQQPVSQHKSSIAGTPVTPQQQPIPEKTIRRDRDYSRIPFISFLITIIKSRRANPGMVRDVDKRATIRK
ncbi:unnamed protein product [Medioppia subpectinata]|uniref:Uncharacterized protein n=1 Tax=Medioppia subpectinata TaxID=1979941 RepID=A0A7R9PYB4_9ACAR|nr:unnamed protein product [Medioppia subpectinata]CAG2105722.1 unnamed protein product [Medioppia subpectinata]